MKKNAVATASKTCTASKCVCDKETKKLVAEKAKLEKALASANAKAAKAAIAFATKFTKAQDMISKLQSTVAALKAKKK